MADDDDFNEVLDQLNERILAAAPAALVKGLTHVQGVSIGLAPVETGNLRGSSGVTAIGLEAELKYPGPYSRAQHYGLEFRHPMGGQALYLEQPMHTEAQKVLEIVADALKEAF